MTVRIVTEETLLIPPSWDSKGWGLVRVYDVCPHGRRIVNEEWVREELIRSCDEDRIKTIFAPDCSGLCDV